MLKSIYLDYATATPLEPSVSFLMQKVYRENFASPSSVHNLGVNSKKILEKSRENIAEILGARSDEIIFTSGSTESNNLAIIGTINATEEKSPHIITTNIEHSSVSEICRHLEKTGQARITYVAVEPNGVVDPKKIRKALRPSTVLVSLMYANSEIGAVEPIREIAKEIRHYNKINSGTNSRKIVFHTDATQAVNYLPIQVEKLGVDLVSISSVKFYGPKGVGVLYIKKNTLIEKTMWGGDQQFDLRAGSYNLPGIVGFARALQITEKIKNTEVARLTKLRDYFFVKLANMSRMSRLNLDINNGIIINGDLKNRLPNNVNITIPKIPSDLLVIELSARGIMVSAKSACASGDSKTSHVIKAINKGAKDTDGSLRFSLGRYTIKADIDYTIKALSEILLKLKRWYN